MKKRLPRRMVNMREFANRKLKKLVNSLVGVQPMSGPTGQIFKLRARYGPDEKETTETYTEKA